MLEREVDLTGDPYVSVGYRYRIAELWDQKLSDSTRAVDGFREILELSPDHAATLIALEGMIAGKREPLAAAEVLDPVYRQLGEWAKLASVQEVRVAYERDAARKVELLHGLAELFEIQLDNAPAAFEAYGRSLAFDPANENTQAALERLAESLGNWTEVTRLYDAGVEQLKASGGDAPCAARAAFGADLRDPGRERRRRHRALPHRGGRRSPRTRRRSRRSIASTSPPAAGASWPRSCARRSRSRPTPDDMLNTQFRLGQVLQARLSRVGDAVGQYRDILAAAPEYQPAVRSLETLFADGQMPMEIGEVLEPLYRMQGAWNALIGVHEVQLSHQPDPDRARGDDAPRGRDRRGQGRRLASGVPVDAARAARGAAERAHRQRSRAPGARDGRLGSAGQHLRRRGLERRVAGREGRRSGASSRASTRTS